MGELTGIEWTDHTFNPWLGCAKVSPACTNCYAEVNRAVASKRVGVELWGPGAARVKTSADYWKQPATWYRRAVKDGVRRRVFCASLADVFEDRVDLDEHRSRLFELIWDTQGPVPEAPGLDWLLLTKRPEKVRELVLRAWQFGVDHRRYNAIPLREWGEGGRPLRNVWLGTTVENQQEAEKRIPALLSVPATVRFLSCEPLLGAVDLGRWLATAQITCKPCGRTFWLHEADPCVHRDRGGWTLACPGCGDCKCVPSQLDRGDCVTWGPSQSWTPKHVGRFKSVHPKIAVTSAVDWVIAGGESGSSARPMHPEWARSIRDQCRAAGVPFFFKQIGEWLPIAAHEWRDEEGYGVVWPSGQWGRGLLGGVDPVKGRVAAVHRVGKKAAGAFLDDVEHKAFPEVRS